MEQAYKYGRKLIRRFGWKGLLNIIMTLCWFFFPFLLWYQLYLWIGQSFLPSNWTFLGIGSILLSNWAIIGIVVVVVVLIVIALCSFLSVELILVREKLVKHVENANRVFDDPANHTSEENFRRECGKFIIPYLHFPSAFTLVFSSLMKRQEPFHVRIIIRLLHLFLHFLISYLLIVLLINNQPNLNQATTLFSSILEWSPQLQDVLTILYQNLILLIVVSFFFSSYCSVQLARGLVPFPSYILDVVSDYFSISTRLIILGTVIGSSPWGIKMRMSRLTFSPFTFQPTTVKEMMQKSVENIEQTECKVTVWQYEVKNTSDVKDLKKMIAESTDIPNYARELFPQVSDEEILKTINNSKPILYLGTIDKRCSIIGRVTYDEKARIYHARFTFDNRYVKNMFKSIAEIQIATQKKLISKLPYSMIQFMRNLKVRKDNEQTRD